MVPVDERAARYSAKRFCPAQRRAELHAGGLAPLGAADARGDLSGAVTGEEQDAVVVGEDHVVDHDGVHADAGARRFGG